MTYQPIKLGNSSGSTPNLNLNGLLSLGTGLTAVTGLTGVTLSLSPTGVLPGTYNALTVDAYGRIVAATNLAALTAIPVTEKGAALGVATLDATGKVPTSQLPAIAITDTFVVTGAIQMLTLAAQTGDVAVRTDLNKSFILKGSNPALLTDWQELLTPTGSTAVSSVFGRTGGVVAASGDYTAGQISLTPTGTIAATNVQAAIQELDGEKQPLSSDLTALASQSGLGFYVNTGTGTATIRTINGTANQISVTNTTGVSGSPVIALASNPVLPGTGAVTPPVGTTAQRPASPTLGMIRGNTTTGMTEIYQGGQWINATPAPLTSTQLTGYQGEMSGPLIFFSDTTRAKVLSVETITLTWINASVVSDDWMQIGPLSSADASYVLPWPGTIIRMMAHCTQTNNRSKYMSLYLDGTEHPKILEVGPTTTAAISPTMSVDFTPGQRIRLRCRTGSTGDTRHINNVVVTAWIKWRL